MAVPRRRGAPDREVGGGRVRLTATGPHITAQLALRAQIPFDLTWLI
jgi:hypothetical protein